MYRQPVHACTGVCVYMLCPAVHRYAVSYVHVVPQPKGLIQEHHTKHAGMIKILLIYIHYVHCVHVVASPATLLTGGGREEEGGGGGHYHTRTCMHGDQ